MDKLLETEAWAIRHAFCQKGWKLKYNLLNFHFPGRDEPMPLVCGFLWRRIYDGVGVETEEDYKERCDTILALAKKGAKEIFKSPPFSPTLEQGKVTNTSGPPQVVYVGGNDGMYVSIPIISGFIVLDIFRERRSVHGARQCGRPRKAIYLC